MEVNDLTETVIKLLIEMAKKNAEPAKIITALEQIKFEAARLQGQVAFNAMKGQIK